MTFRLFFCFCISFLLHGSYSIAQVDIQLYSLDLKDTTDQNIYIVGDFNDWKENDPLYALKRKGPNQWTISLPKQVILPIEFKFTRGSWEKVESDGLGYGIPNREISQPGAYDLSIPSWLDRPELKSPFTAKIRVTEIPENTPEGAAIWVVGNFNNWNVSDSTYLLRRSETSLWEVDIPFASDSLLYKFSRGAWSKVEGQYNGRARENRIIQTNPWTQVYVAIDQIESWEDLDGRYLNPFSLFLIIAAIQGLLLVLLMCLKLSSIKDPKIYLLLLLLFTSTALFTKASVFHREIFQVIPKIYLIPDTLLFLYGPLFYLFSRGFLQLKSIKKPWASLLLFSPFIIHIGIMIPRFFIDKTDFIYDIVDSAFMPIDQWIGLVALMFNLFLWLSLSREIKKNLKKGRDPLFVKKRKFIQYMLQLMYIVIVLWIVIYLIGGYGEYIMKINVDLITELLSDVIWLLLALCSIITAYFTIMQPKIFQYDGFTLRLKDIQKQELRSAASQKDEHTSSEDKTKSYSEQLKKLLEFMEKEKPYLNSKLKIGDLATDLNTSSHQLSKLINEELDKNFNDFVNGYRIEEFRKILLEEKHPNLTLLAYAYMVGFNSKTAFNRSFKRLTGGTPGDFMKKLKINQDS